MWLVFCPSLHPIQKTTSARRTTSSDSVVPSGFRTPAALLPVSATEPFPEKLVTTIASRRSASASTCAVAREACTPPPATITGRRELFIRSAAAEIESVDATGR